MVTMRPAWAILCCIFLWSCRLDAGSVAIFRSGHVYFGGGENHRTISAVAQLPGPDRQFSNIYLDVRLHCPDGGCDWWDRRAAVHVLDDDRRPIEIFRFMTPYGVGSRWRAEVTDLRPLLTGDRTFEVFIDTWVGPGHAQGAGWLVDVSLEFVDGIPEHPVTAVIPVFRPQSVDYGDSWTELRKLVLVTGENAGGRLYAWITGHGQGNTENCAEFCPKQHTISVGTQWETKVVWRDDCDRTVTDGPQRGTWPYPRAGWCPGDQVYPLAIEVPASAFTGTTPIRWSPEAYANERNTGYDGGGHTKPFYQVSALLVLYGG